MQKFQKISKRQWLKDKYGFPTKEGDGQFERFWTPGIEEEYQLLKLPLRSTERSGGYDIFSTQDFELLPNEEILMPLGFKIYLNDFRIFLVLPRSGSGFRFYARLANTIGVIDGDYADNEDNEGHCWIKLRNEGTKTWEVKSGRAIAQGIIFRFDTTDDDDARGKRKGGFGSTG